MNLQRDRFFGLGLWPRMALAISLGFLALFAAFAIVAERALQDSQQRILDERLVITQMVASELDALLLEAISELKAATRFVDFDSMNDALSDEAEALALTFGGPGHFSAGVTFIGTDGRVILSDPPELYAPNEDLSDLPYIAQALAGREPTISEPFMEPLNNVPVTAVTVPLYDGNRFLGLLSGLLDLNGPGVRQSLQRATFLGETAHSVLFNKQGETIASTFDLPFLSPGEHGDFYQRVMMTPHPVVEIVEFELDLHNEPEGHLHVMAVAPLQTVPWGVGLGGDVDTETFAAVYALRRSLIILGITAFIAIWTATLLGARRLVRPMQELTEQARQIAAGDLAVNLTTTKGGEIGEMAAALEDMRCQLLANIEALSELNETLEMRVETQTHDLRHQKLLTEALLGQVITAQESERKRLSYELHDEIGQMLTAVELSLHLLDNVIAPDDVHARQRLQRSERLTRQTVTELRRIIAALRPGVLDQLGLIPALDWLAENMMRPVGIEVTITENEFDGRLPLETETILFRISQEAMNNVVRHGQAAHFWIDLVYGDGRVTLILRDDGRGFDLSRFKDDNRRDKLGLAGIRERAALAGGDVTIETTPGQGTTICVIIPVLELQEEKTYA